MYNRGILFFMNVASPVVLEGTALGAILAVALIILVAMSFVFVYHWRRFGIETPLFRKMRRLYFTVSTVFAILSVMFYIFILISF